MLKLCAPQQHKPFGNFHSTLYLPNTALLRSDVSVDASYNGSGVYLMSVAVVLTCLLSSVTTDVTYLFMQYYGSCVFVDVSNYSHGVFVNISNYTINESDDVRTLEVTYLLTSVPTGKCDDVSCYRRDVFVDASPYRHYVVVMLVNVLFVTVLAAIIYIY